MRVAHDESRGTPAPTAAVPSSPRRRPVVPVAAAVTALMLGAVQAWALAAWASRRDLGLRDVMIKWDAGWMTKIAEFGYFGFSVSLDPQERVEWQSVAFLPGYPVLVRIASAPLAVLGREDATFVGGLAASAVASIVFAWGVARLAADMWSRSRVAEGAPPPSVRAQAALAVAVTVLAFGAPMSFLYWMPYTEALFGALAVWTLVMVLRRRYLVAGVLTLGAGLTRITAVALVLMLCAVAAVELWHWARRRTAFPAGAVAAPVVGSLGMAAYIAWANAQVAEIGGYFAAQRRGWNSQVDLGVATFAWLREHLLLSGLDDRNEVAYVLSSWAIIAVFALCAASLWPLARGWVPWQVWLVAILVAGSVLGSDGIMHARPRLLLLPVLLLLLPFVVRVVDRIVRGGPRRPRRLALVAATGVLWCVVGFTFFGWMIVEFQYGI